MIQPHFLWLLAPSFVAGALNSIAGGGTFITFPSLLWAGIPPVVANATNTLGLFPASLAACFTNASELRKVRSFRISHCLAASLAGGVVGAELLMRTPESRFVAFIPYLLLFATLAFTFGKRITQWMGEHRLPKPAILPAFFILAVYGGYFGGGVGILLLAVMGLFGLTNLTAMNALKNLLAGCLNGIAVVLFALHGSIHWPAAILMVGASVAGGFFGAHYSKKADPLVMRRIISGVGWAMTLYFFRQNLH